ncbi:Asp-tRNA(Asn)/Glu-tRNA(Gln) amidotransferase GatCAB subunit B [bacterium (Candidatus Blackallbacteria) CG17_big_fil_post_rev_8_21_14_2_50_48_46]|uniref:Aspartyl/glutamyl-tRNA(Asn/Gln) amidotransferase subunit B n=1 Tax=bacterium (Candidatus Blackallbacteria) CG17_big_fil_post_rev_8_21_14_2_50_48_46 TaxID=2014261 RepID=A0A2M7G7R0_9BACT|nr:MAG: Asp-tRNA(Asn)/Glu-tRNA(Gln) amidotransferase GatCAB subunit B [bacterium (Candidatus Blackallbacteria) CG18_big_fil_WC_8_21_14_2_50_49_26]PIW18121.1 MAG: Asp-tRNA(Asn)/Glu-tRNA(Gln) amidotransferase GatCAB subunit B [bacterium (Candidatus Blackallbacteria) CG17_big_fil_post_rev_8_21_14_2_50_48_46]PIW51130.1 MAG: Asp-tRNA(Asn)/Glu-tRNA(Gln) amidotransferase GatCAB subunit B [bacterium (Candidatus Blackallbacteria) CG13_big_fil_rev_8_21_14_2_50_49_14]
MTDFEAVIGLEVHAELLTDAKLFCESAAHFGAAPNTHVGPVSLGLPGTLPVLNQRVVEMGIRAGLATHCQIPAKTKFDRKHYFYPDLPKGYQITQFDQPIAENGWLEVQVEDQVRHIRLKRIHMEEDAGKLVHAGADRMAGSVYSLIDFNRAGVPLLEIVSEPDIHSSNEARAYLEELRSILMAIGVCDGKMQEGSLRCDANISVRPVGSEVLGTRVEIKNINSFRFLQRAVDYEIQRQITAIECGESLVQETRLWDEQKHRTISMRSKEDAHDYRYFPDPDLVDLEIDPAWVLELAESLPELPAARRKRYVEVLGLSEADASTLVAEPSYLAFFEATLAAGAEAREACKWLIGDIAAYLNEKHLGLEETRLSSSKFAELLTLLQKGTISGKIAKTLVAPLLETEQTAQELIEASGLTQISDSSALEGIILQVLEKNPEQVQQFLEGKEKVIGFLVGQVMKLSQGRAEPAQTNQLLRELLLKKKQG